LRAVVGDRSPLVHACGLNLAEAVNAFVDVEFVEEARTA
jgi:hypothetical protein